MLQVTYVRESTEFSGEIDAVAHDELVTDLEAQVVDFDFSFKRGGFD
jgi:hypothetical protein